MKIAENIEGIISSGGALAEELSEQIRAKIHHPVIEFMAVRRRVQLLFGMIFPLATIT